MATERNALWLASFPHLAAEGYTETSPATREYNCIAWAAGQTDDWWWPDAFGAYHWPDGVARIATVENFVQAFGTVGYIPCEDGSLEAAHEKIAIYALNGAPTHAARQLPDGSWTSKLGCQIDLTHTLHGLENSLYGQVVAFLKRPIRRP